MVQLGILSSAQANAAIQLSTVFLLMGLMLILGMLEEKGQFIAERSRHEM